MFIFSLLLLLLTIDLYYVSFFETYFMNISEVQFIVAPGITHIHFFALFIFLFILNRSISKMSMDKYYSDYSDWMALYIILTKMKYTQFLIMRSVFVQFNILLNIYAYWKNLFIKSNAPIQVFISHMKIYFYYLHVLKLFNQISMEKLSLNRITRSLLRGGYFASFSFQDN